MERTDLVAQAVRLALAAGMAGVISLSPAYSQDETDELAVQEKITVTGSRIKRADYEGPLPITVINREDIENSGEISVSEILRTQTFNTFGSGKQRSGETWGNVNAVSMRGLGEWYTLVLVNGRRMASAPTVAANAQNISMIPLAAVERIEVLRDGASAIYGTDALAGVINIILRRDYSGINLSYAIGRPTQSGGDEDSYSITGGISGARGNVTFGMDAQKQDIVYDRDRDFTQGGSSWWGFPSSYFGFLTTEDPRNPTGQFLSVGTFADPRCPAELGSDPEFPWSVEVSNNWGGVVCRYAWWGESATEAANDTKSFFVDANYEITDRAQFFTRGIFSYNEVSGRYAPSPLSLEMSQDAPRRRSGHDGGRPIRSQSRLSKHPGRQPGSRLGRCFARLRGRRARHRGLARRRGLGAGGTVERADVRRQIAGAGPGSVPAIRNRRRQFRHLRCLRALRRRRGRVGHPRHSDVFL
jgi:iron complex outermembrane receptor protein